MTDRGDVHQALAARVRISAAGVTIHRLAAPSQPPAEADSPQPMDVEPIEEEEKNISPQPATTVADEPIDEPDDDDVEDEDVEGATPPPEEETADVDAAARD